jgi:hypothetical protein
LVSTPPRSEPTMPRGMPISLSTATAPSWYSDMSTRIIFFSSPKRRSRDRLRSSVLPTPGRAQEQQDAVRPVEAVLQRSLVQTRPASHRLDRIALTDDPLAEIVSTLRKPVGDLAEHHVLGMRAIFEMTLTTSPPVTSQRFRSRRGRPRCPASR